MVKKGWRQDLTKSHSSRIDKPVKYIHVSKYDTSCCVLLHHLDW